jgi:hypothetical protein
MSIDLLDAAASGMDAQRAASRSSTASPTAGSSPNGRHR